MKKGKILKFHMSRFKINIFNKWLKVSYYELIYHTLILSLKYLNISNIERMQNDIACLLSQKRQHNIWCRWIYVTGSFINHLNYIYHANSVFTVFNYLLQYNIVFGYRHFVYRNKDRSVFLWWRCLFFLPLLRTIPTLLGSVQKYIIQKNKIRCVLFTH